MAGRTGAEPDTKTEITPQRLTPGAQPAPQSLFPNKKNTRPQKEQVFLYKTQYRPHSLADTYRTHSLTDTHRVRSLAETYERIL